MKRDIGVWILSLFFFGSVLTAFGMYRDYQKKPQAVQQEKSVQGADTEVSIVKNVIDGDTLTLSDGVKVRLIGINAPEENQPGFLQAKSKLENLVLGKSIRVDTDVEKTDKYGRTLGYVYAGDTFVNLELIKSGLAVVETIQPDSLHADELIKAQIEARKNCSGMWEGLCHPDASACVQLASIHQSSVSVGLNDEWVVLQNTCSTSQNLQ